MKSEIFGGFIRSIVFLIVLLMVSLTAFASETITVRLNDKLLDFDVEPQLIDGRTMVPLRTIFEALGAEIEWENTTRTVYAEKDDIVVECSIGNNLMYVNGDVHTMDVAPIIVDGRTLVPARFVAESFGCDVGWDPSTRTVYITVIENELDGPLSIDEYNKYTDDELFEMNA